MYPSFYQHNLDYLYPRLYLTQVSRPMCCACHIVLVIACLMYIIYVFSWIYLNMFLEIVELFSCGYKGVFLSACRCVYCLIRIVLLLRVCFLISVFLDLFSCVRTEGRGGRCYHVCWCCVCQFYPSIPVNLPPMRDVPSTAWSMRHQWFQDVLIVDLLKQDNLLPR